MPYKDKDQLRQAKRSHHIKRTNARNDLLRKAKEKGCELCGKENSLEFHHVNPIEKLFTIGKTKTYNLQKLQEEIDKCVVLCRSCHIYVHRNFPYEVK